MARVKNLGKNWDKDKHGLIEETFPIWLRET